jgi:hypothetical protein
VPIAGTRHFILSEGRPESEAALFTVGQVQYPGQSKCSKVASSQSLSLGTRGSALLKCMLRLVRVHLLEQLDSTIAVTKNDCRSQGCVAQGCVAHGGSAVLHVFNIMCAHCALWRKSPTDPIVIQVRIGEGTRVWVPARSEENEVVPENTTARPVKRGHSVGGACLFKQKPKLFLVRCW